uniref:Succinate dehydrogenase iron-sulfur subunit n=1 Tax=Candidatus Aschnera chinzeii TaxID=1485666 RepID=A0AAT9G3X5_9ENTR|nr:MAG: succinate dehydrogenase iron-sulfur subunit [Candidatus Aschnera chinzeii]
MKISFSIYRYNSIHNQSPYMQDYKLDLALENDLMLLDALLYLKEQDPTLAFRYSCREGVCGSDGLNVNGKNVLACITPISSLYNNKKIIVIRPLPGLPIIRDLIVDMEQFYEQYEKITPYLINDANHITNHEFLQTPNERKKLDGLYECIMCGCCSTACPSFWWNPDKFIGPAGLLAAYRFLLDSRDHAKNSRLNKLNDLYSVFRCHSIMNCVHACPKGLNPSYAINQIKLMLLKLII